MDDVAMSNKRFDWADWLLITGTAIAVGWAVLMAVYWR